MPMSAIKVDATAVDVTVTDERLTVILADVGSYRPLWRGFRACWRPRMRSVGNGD